MIALDCVRAVSMMLFTCASCASDRLMPCSSSMPIPPLWCQPDCAKAAPLQEISAVVRRTWEKRMGGVLILAPLECGASHLDHRALSWFDIG